MCVCQISDTNAPHTITGDKCASALSHAKVCMHFALMWMHAWKCVLSPKHKLHKYMSLNASIQASSISCIIAFLKYVRLRFIMQCKDVMQRKQHAFRAVPINASWSSQHHGLSSKNSICSDLLRALDEVWCGVAWPARPLRSRETAWGQREGPSSLCWTLGLQSDRQSDHGSHFLIYNDGSQQQRVWMRWFYTLKWLNTQTIWFHIIHCTKLSF